MKRFAVTLAVVGMVMLFATFAVGFYAWAPYASWGGYAKGGYGSSSSSGYYPASSSSSGYWPAIQLRSLKTEVEKGSTSTLIECRLAGPKHKV